MSKEKTENKDQIKDSSQKSKKSSYSKKPNFFKINGDVKIEEISGKIEQILSV